jgi:two-component SAPR family response regulator
MRRGLRVGGQGRREVSDWGCPVMPHVELRSLGEFRLTIGGKPVERWRAGKARNLFQYLIVHPGQVMPRITLQSALWPESEFRGSSSSSLKVAVHMLRSILSEHSGGAGTAVDQPVLRLVTRDTGYLLEAQHVWVDFRAFNDLIQRACAMKGQGDDDASIALLRSAVNLYRGDFLPGEELEWVEVQREWLRSRMLFALDCVTSAEVARADYLGAVNSCHRALELEPCREETYQTLMVLHARLGHLDQVRRWYRICTARLWDVLEVRPEQRTQRLYREAMLGRMAVGRTELTLAKEKRNA